MIKEGKVATLRKKVKADINTITLPASKNETKEIEFGFEQELLKAEKKSEEKKIKNSNQIVSQLYMEDGVRTFRNNPYSELDPKPLFKPKNVIEDEQGSIEDKIDQKIAEDNIPIFEGEITSKIMSESVEDRTSFLNTPLVGDVIGGRDRRRKERQREKDRVELITNDMILKDRLAQMNKAVVEEPVIDSLDEIDLESLEEKKQKAEENAELRMEVTESPKTMDEVQANVANDLEISEKIDANREEDDFDITTIDIDAIDKLFDDTKVEPLEEEKEPEPTELRTLTLKKPEVKEIQDVQEPPKAPEVKFDINNVEEVDEDVLSNLIRTYEVNGETIEISHVNDLHLPEDIQLASTEVQLPLPEEKEPEVQAEMEKELAELLEKDISALPILIFDDEDDLDGDQEKIVKDSTGEVTPIQEVTEVPEVQEVVEPTVVATEPVKKKRGRKPGSKNKPKVDNTLFGIEGVEEIKLPKKRGRKPGQKNKATLMKEQNVVVAPAPVVEAHEHEFMSFCTHCGKKLQEGAIFCGYCGSKIN